ncbi:Cof-type HAD-IIB family hydrolase [Bacillus sp. Marseille-P3661]|uniref:Cof-type HAD-IIB family hydrolase n=1 Tax=Bacillus sp. Marseille-P3661 TaxID=1936234 RepID=UPI000C8589D4|nr:Cof-type HAD-IIB family hydrolase [Bacillus sp. Marseille-P3661]
MKRKLIFFDIDGTLLDEEKNLPASTKQALQTLENQGHEVAIATGRSPFMFKELREELGIHTYVSYNGQYVVFNNQVVRKNPLNQDMLRALTKFALENGHPLVYMDHEDMKANIEFHPHIEKSIQSLKFAHPQHDPTYYEDREIFQSLLFCTEDEEREYIDKFEGFDFVRWHPVSTDVLPSGGSKANGIKVIIDHLGFNNEDVYAFGDGLNDIEMLTYVANSVAMGNAHDDVKKVAKHITKDVSEDGIVYGLELVGLLK